MVSVRKRVLIVDLQQIYQGVRSLYVPLIYGVLRVHAEQCEAVRDAYEWLEPLCVPDGLDRLLAQVDAPDVVGFSTYLWNEQNSHRLARAVREKYPSALIVFGGPQIPQDPSNYLDRHPWVDLCVHGEGEQPFTGILAELLREDRDWDRVAGISFLRDGRQRFTAPGERLASLDLPSPFILGYFDAFVARGRAQGFNIVASLETTRGCPYHCAFCNWGMATGTKPRQYPEERVRAEFAWVAQQQIFMVFLIDANFGLLPRDVGLLEYFAELKRTTGRPQSVMLSGFAKNNKDRTFEITRLLQDHQLDEGVTVNFSLQAMSPDTLDAIFRQNIPLDSYRALSDRYAQNGYVLTPDLIFPLPGETLDSFKAGYADLASWDHVNRIRTYPCCILPNSPMAKPAYREEWGLRTRIETLRLPLLEPICADLADEFVETVTATRLISPTDGAEARLFVVVVNALEICGLTAALRRGLTRRHGVTPLAIHERFIAWQRRPGGFLAEPMREMTEVFLEGPEHGDALGWSGHAHTFDGQRYLPVKVLTYDCVCRPEAFRADLRDFVTHGLGIPWSDVEEDLLAYSADAWIGPDYDPNTARAFPYRYDWPSFLAGEALEARPIEVIYTPRPSVLQFGYAPSPEQWTLHFLAAWQPDTFCSHHARAGASTRQALAARRLNS